MQPKLALFTRWRLRCDGILSTKFYEKLSKSPDKAGASRQVILETMKKYPNPQDWGGFTTISLL